MIVFEKRGWKNEGNDLLERRFRYSRRNNFKPPMVVFFYAQKRLFG